MEKESITSLGGSFAHNIFVGMQTKERRQGVERRSEGELVVDEAIFRSFEQEGWERLLEFGHGRWGRDANTDRGMITDFLRVEKDRVGENGASTLELSENPRRSEHIYAIRARQGITGGIEIRVL